MTFLTDVINYRLSPKGVSYGCDGGHTPKFEDTLIGCVSSLKEARYGPLTHSWGVTCILGGQKSFVTL